MIFRRQFDITFQIPVHPSCYKMILKLTFIAIISVYDFKRDVLEKANRRSSGGKSILCNSSLAAIYQICVHHLPVHATLGDNGSFEIFVVNLEIYFRLSEFDNFGITNVRYINVR